MSADNKTPQQLVDELEQALRSATAWENLFLKERGRRQAYERALGLSFWSERAVEDELWSRAQSGDQLAIEVLKARMAQENGLAPEVIPGK